MSRLIIPGSTAALAETEVIGTLTSPEIFPMVDKSHFVSLLITQRSVDHTNNFATGGSVSMRLMMCELTGRVLVESA